MLTLVTLYLKSILPISGLQNGKCVHLNLKCCKFTGNVAKTKSLINIRVCPKACCCPTSHLRALHPTFSVTPN